MHHRCKYLLDIELYYVTTVPHSCHYKVNCSTRYLHARSLLSLQ
jgi:hypothetical protein